MGFGVPQTAADWRLKLQGNTNWAQARSGFEELDDTRRRFYTFLEQQFDSWGRNGRQCLLRTICQVAESPIRHNGLIGELLHVVFT